LQAVRAGGAGGGGATGGAARGIDLPNLDLVIHADIPNDPEVMQHRSGRTGRAGRKGVSVLLVPPARRRRAELLLNLAGIDAAWGTAPQPEEIRSLDQERMLCDPLLTEETTSDDLILAQALLAQRSPEDIAAALARLYRARLPSPEDILDPGQSSGRPRDDRGRDKGIRSPRGDDRSVELRSKTRKSSARHEMTEGGVWFRVAIGRRKNAEARWLLPMICRRGGIEKQDVGTIRVLDTTTEFEISGRVVASFTAKVRRPDKEDNIRIEPLADADRDHAPSEQRSHQPRREAGDIDRGAHRSDNSDGATEQKHYGKPRAESRVRSDRTPGFEKKNKHRNKPAPAGQPQRAPASHAKKRKPKNNRRG
jgi:ATP-dependent RNA helicase DeaD